MIAKSKLPSLLQNVVFLMEVLNFQSMRAFRHVKSICQVDIQTSDHAISSAQSGVKKKVNMIRKHHNHTPQTNPRHREEVKNFWKCKMIIQKTIVIKLGFTTGTQILKKNPWNGSALAHPTTEISYLTISR